ncbi:MAG TPA: NADP transhydrogenase subunit alpha [Deltaproteobacteria bacterium]|nr:NADP transhydrogenase subunit alpha [Deltaproteobacteria bacterium]
MENSSGLKIAVVGAGVAGIVAAHVLQRSHDITLYEKNDYIGGHTHTILIEDGVDAGTPVDTGFIVCNDKTYPNFLKFLDQLGVARQKSTMSFSYYDPSRNFFYGSLNADTFFIQRRSILNPSFWRMILGILSFNQGTPRLLHQGRLAGFTMGEYLKAHRYNRFFIEDYLLPITAAVWSAPDVKMLDFPMETFARFFENHGLFSIIRHPQWYTITGGSHTYVKAFLNGFRGRVLQGVPVRGIRREDNSVFIKADGLEEERYDRVVVACHADEAFEMLCDPSEEEAALLNVWTYSKNRTVLHTDTAVLPPEKKIWLSWNYLRLSDVTSGSPVVLTYNMNRLQSLTTRNTYCVTLNPHRTFEEGRIIRDMVYTHPRFSFDTIATQPRLREISGRRNTYYCGSYHGYGFHEDGVRSALNVAASFGMRL